MSKKVRVLVVDDSAFMRSMLVRMIDKDARFEVVGKATNGQEGVAKVKELKPDVVTMDIEMPIMNGLDALDAIMKECPTPVVMVSSLTEEGAQATLSALEKGAIDFIPKAMHDDNRNILRSVNTLHDKLMAASRVKMGAEKSPVEKLAPLTPALLPKPKIVIIGSSTGGPRALQELIPTLPATLNVPIVIAQHMPAAFTGAMAQRLNDMSNCPVVEAQEGGSVQAGTVYIAKGGHHLRIQGDETNPYFSIRENQGESFFQPSVNILAESALNIFGKDILAIMLTGMGNDGAKSFVEIKKTGGYVIAQDEATCTVYGMPKAVVENNGASEVLAINQISGRIKPVV